MGHDQHTVAVFAPILSLTITIEQGAKSEVDEVHFHPGGQGFWTARMLRHLGERPLVCGPVGGESGRVIRGLLGQWGIDVSPVEIESDSPITIHDRRSGEREEVAITHPPSLSRHDFDDFYTRFFDRALSCGTAVIAGQTREVVPVDQYRRLGHDLRTTKVRVVADLHGDELRFLLEGGPVDILKVSDENLRDDGLLRSDDDDEALRAIGRLVASGATSVVLSRADRPALASIEGAILRACPPELVAADFRGAGDSMTAGLATALRAGLAPADMLKLACGAGAANVTRHGLGSTAEGLFANLAKKVEVTTVVGVEP